MIRNRKIKLTRFEHYMTVQALLLDEEIRRRPTEDDAAFLAAGSARERDMLLGTSVINANPHATVMSRELEESDGM